MSEQPMTKKMFSPVGIGLEHAWCRNCGKHLQKHVAPNESCPEAPKISFDELTMLLMREDDAPVRILPDGTIEQLDERLPKPILKLVKEGWDY